MLIGVFKTILDIRGTNQGNPKLSIMEIIDDFKPDDAIAKKHHLPKDRHCRPKSFALTSDLSTPTRMILCPMFFTRGTIDPSLRKVPPGYKPVTGSTVEPVTCASIGSRVGPAMATKGQTILHEYTHVAEVMQSVFGGGVSPKGRTDDHAYGFDRCRKLDKNYARINADSYASFATELFWTTMCERDFDPPAPVAQSASPEEQSDMLDGLDLGSTKKGESSAKGTQQQKSQREIQSVALSLHKRTAFSQPYEHPTPRTDLNHYTVGKMDRFLQGHIDALHICSAVIEQATCNPDRFDRIFGEYFRPEDRRQVLGKSPDSLQVKNKCKDLGD